MVLLLLVVDDVEDVGDPAAMSADSEADSVAAGGGGAGCGRMGRRMDSMSPTAKNGTGCWLPILL